MPKGLRIELYKCQTPA